DRGCGPGAVDRVDRPVVVAQSLQLALDDLHIRARRLPRHQNRARVAAPGDDHQRPKRYLTIKPLHIRVAEPDASVGHGLPNRGWVIGSVYAITTPCDAEAHPAAAEGSARIDHFLDDQPAPERRRGLGVADGYREGSHLPSALL